MQSSVDERTALIAARDGNRTGRMCHSEPVRAGTVSARICARNQHGVGAGCWCYDVADLGCTDPEAGPQGGPGWRLQADPWTEIVPVDNFADVYSDAIARVGGEGPGIHF